MQPFKATFDNMAVQANAGDSRCVICSKGFAEALSTDHKPDVEGDFVTFCPVELTIQGAEEAARVRAAGGFVSADKRVNGKPLPWLRLPSHNGLQGYSLHRAHSVTSSTKTARIFRQRSKWSPSCLTSAYILLRQRTNFSSWLVMVYSVAGGHLYALNCVGIWDVLTSQQVANAVRRLVAQRVPLESICEEIMERCLSPRFGGVGCDNMTIVVVALLHGRTLEEWYDWITARVEKGEGYETPATVPRFWSELEQDQAKITWEDRKWAAENARKNPEEGGWDSVYN